MTEEKKITINEADLTKLLSDVSAKAAKEAITEELKTRGLDKIVSQKFGYKGSAAEMTEEKLTKLSMKEKAASFIKAVYSCFILSK